MKPSLSTYLQQETYKYINLFSRKENIFVIDTQGVVSHEYFPDEHICNTDIVHSILHTLS